MGKDKKVCKRKEPETSHERSRSVSDTEDDAHHAEDGKKQRKLKKSKTKKTQGSKEQIVKITTKSDGQLVVKEKEEARQKLKSLEPKRLGADKQKPQPTPKEIRTARREERKRLLGLVPKEDEHGIAYTKQQIRFMRKRVARGLDPLETEQEKAQRLQQEAELRREEEAELAGILHQKDSDDSDGDDHEHTVGEHMSEGDAVAGGADGGLGDKNVMDEPETCQNGSARRQSSPKKKKRRAKPVPADYTCQACQNKHIPPHWIYDCPSKITMRGTNQVSSKQKGLHDPDARKVFVSGLPFDTTKKDVSKLFSPCGKLQFCKLLTFADSGRCKGQAILAFASLEGAQKALEQNGSMIDNNADEKSSSENRKEGKKPRQKLKLSVTKLLNRSRTKQRKKPEASVAVDQ